MVGDTAKFQALRQIARGAAVRPFGRSKVQIGNKVIHVRFRSTAKTLGGAVWLFTLTPSTLTADYELWICGSALHYYLIPKAVIERIYTDPSERPGYTQNEIWTAEINSRTHSWLRAKGKSVDLSGYFKAQL